MSKWRKKTLRLKKDHQWRGTPGNQVFVANRGDVRFEFPGDWIMIPTEESIKFHDKQPPDDDVILQCSVIRLSPEIDWSGYPPAKLLADVSGDDERGVTWRGPVRRELRQNMEIATTEVRFIDPVEKREALGRACIARAKTVQTYITMDYWPEHAEKFEPVWDTVLRTLRLAEDIKDPRTGARFGYG